MTDGVAPIDQSLMPAAVRNGGAQRKKEYEAALSFERVLVGQLTQQLTKSFGGDDEDGGTDAATSQMKQQLPGTLADALMASGGMGLAGQLDAMWHQGDAKSTSVSANEAGGATAGAPTTSTSGGGATA